MRKPVRYLNAPVVIQAPSSIGFDINVGESDPRIFKNLCLLVKSMSGKKVWDPFAGHTRKSVHHDIADKVGIKLVSYDIKPIDDRVVLADSTVTRPEIGCDGFFFHPPYFGTRPFSQDPREISLIHEWKDYVEALQKTVKLIGLEANPDSVVFAVGRKYTGVPTSLDILFLDLFSAIGYELFEVEMLYRDIVLKMRRNK